MKKIIVSALVAAVVAVGVLGGRSALADDRREPRVIRFLADDVQQDQLDLGAPGLSIGDRWVFTDDLYLRQGGEPVGIAGGDCGVVRVESSSFTYHCVVSLQIPQGTVVVQGLLTLANGVPPATFSLAITGGTGAFTDIGGRIDVRSLGGTLSTLTLHFSRRSAPVE